MGEVEEALTIVPPPFVTRELPMAMLGETEFELAVIETGLIDCKLGDLFDPAIKRWSIDAVPFGPDELVCCSCRSCGDEV